MISPARTSSAFYLNGLLVDTVMLDYEAQQKHNGAKLHTVRQAITKLRTVAYLASVNDTAFLSESEIEKWVKQARI